MLKRFSVWVTVVTFSLVLMGVNHCDGTTSSPSATKQTQSQKAAEAADSINFSENAEIDNITARLKLTSDPGLVGYVALINGMGQVVMYTTVQGKITSGGKRLTNPTQLYKIDRGEYNGSSLGPAPSDEGTWGSSNPYVYFTTTAGQYVQWSGLYLYSDKPFRLTVEPILFGIEEPGETSIAN